jgi:GPH family glycoside/pentoside/hexuronide:cation symporter
MNSPNNSSASANDRLTIGTCLGFGVGTVGVSIMLNTVTTYFPAFMATVLGQSPELAGYLLMGSKLYDAIADVIIGRMSDRTRSRWGRRRPYLLIGAIVSAGSFFMIFMPPKLDDTALVLYMSAALVIYSTGYSLFNVPYMTMPSEMTRDFQERTRLLSWRTLFVSLGQLLALAVTAALVQSGGGGANGYARMGLVMGLIIFGAMTATFLGTARAARVENLGTPARLAGGQFSLLWRNRPFMLLLGAKVFQFLAFASIATTGLLFQLNVLHVGYRGQILLAVTTNIAMALTTPLWVRVGRSLGKRGTYLIGVVLFCAGSLSWLLATPGISDAAIVARGLIAGAGSSALILMSVSMLGDTMAYDRALTGLYREGFLSALIAVIEKTAFAAGVAVIGLMLTAAHYIPTFGGQIVAQPESAVRALYWGFAVIPALMFLANGGFLLFYRLEQATLDNTSKD